MASTPSLSSLISVFLLDANGVWHASRHFNTLRPARKWAKWLGTLSYVREVAIYRGGQGGERLA